MAGKRGLTWSRDTRVEPSAAPESGVTAPLSLSLRFRVYKTGIGPHNLQEHLSLHRSVTLRAHIPKHDFLPLTLGQANRKFCLSSGPVPRTLAYTALRKPRVLFHIWWLPPGLSTLP